jgi:hypothetical protein
MSENSHFPNVPVRLGRLYELEAAQFLDGKVVLFLVWTEHDNPFYFFRLPNKIAYECDKSL